MPRCAVQTGSRRCEDDDGGFTIIEVMVAITFLTLVLLAAEWGVIGTMSASSVAKEHSEATSLISQTVAQAESLKFNDLWMGLNPSGDNLSADSNITTTGATTYVLKLNNATIATCSTASTVPPVGPLLPHIATITDGISYRVAAYPIASTSCSSPPPFNATVTLVVIVSWKAPTGNTDHVVGETEISQT